MREGALRAACGLVLALLIPLSGCASSSTPEAPPTTAPATSESPGADAGSPGVTPLPPAPADVSGMKDWFAEAYPDAAWLARITDVAYVSGEVPDSGGFANAIVVTTDLDFDGEQPLAQEIVSAIGEADPDWAEQYVIRFADGRNIQAGDIFDPTP